MATQQKADKAPEFPGGQYALVAYISSHVIYPPEAREKGIQGKVFVRFTVTTKGKIQNAEVT